MRPTALLLASALALSPVLALAAEPYAPGYEDDAYAYQRSGSGGEAYSYRRDVSERDGAVVRGEVNCQGYCLPPGYRIEEPVRYEEPGGYDGEPVYHDEQVRTGGPVYAEREDRYGARRTSYEESGGYSWGYEERGEWERRDDSHDGWDREPCRRRYDDRGRVLESCGEIRLSDSFFWGGGGVGPEYIDAGGGGGGGGYAVAGAGASAYASASASVGVSIRIGGRGGHKGGHGGGKPHGGCGKCGGH